ncbi:MAG: DNA polymerase/3'-5' exonuclease PolX [Salinirussus sp.]
MTRNAEIAALLEEFADRLEAKDVEYKPRAYRDAAESVRDYPDSVEELAFAGADPLQEIEDVGEAIAGKIVEYVETGEIEELEELRAEVPADFDELTRVEGVGPKTVQKLYEALGVTDLDDLEAAAEAGKIREVSGFGPKTEQNILDNLDFARRAHERQLLGDARPLADAVKTYLGNVDGVVSVETGGSIRRWRPTIGDVDVLAASDVPETVVDAFMEWPEADVQIEGGTNKASVRSGDVRIDLRVVVPEEFGSALQYFTGSKEHNVALRQVAIDQDLKMNEYGIFDVSDVADPDAGQRVGERVGGETEESMYAALDMPWIPPELREDRGEVAAAQNGTLPSLIEEGGVRGDLHVHTTWSDGQLSIHEMATAAEEFGHEYLAICDHATGPGMVGGVGLDDDDLRDQAAEIRDLDSELEISLFAGVEANIRTDGSISVGDDVLADLDLVVASPHAALDGDGTDRLITAAEHPAVDIIGHPTGRYLNQREGLDLDIDAVAAAAADNNTALEINANPQRLDLSGRAVQLAIEAGAMVAINTDAHRAKSFSLVRYGIHTARRGWAEPGDVLNAQSVEAVRSAVE